MWYKMEDKQPQEGQVVLAYPVYMAVSIGEYTIKQPVHTLIYYKGQFWDCKTSSYCCGTNQIQWNITHWMPLREPPNAV